MHRSALTPISIAATCLGALACDAPTQRSDPASIRELDQGRIVGEESRYGAHQWLGIPYAEQPVGDLRWRAPRPPGAWGGVRKATTHPPPCPQYATPYGVHDAEPGAFVGLESCLYLNVYAPSARPHELPTGGGRLPVMVWIHGGGNIVGLARNYDGGNLAQTQNVIVVVPQYRLGPLGWLRHRALSDGADARDASGNYGLLDLIQALRWVHENISAFGGDPGRVTIFGESAGARNVMALLRSPIARGLFHRAIAQSGSSRQMTAERAEQPSDEGGAKNSSSELLVRMLQRDGRASSRDGAKSTAKSMRSDEIARYLRGKSAAEILGSYPKGMEGIARIPNVISDGVVIPEAAPLDAFATRGGFTPVPIMLGTNRDEMKTFMALSPEWVNRYLRVIIRVKSWDLYEAGARAMSSYYHVTGAHAPAAAMLGVTRGVYVYRWDWDEQPSLFGTDLSALLGAGHGLEIPFVFGHWDLGRLANLMFDEDNEPGRSKLSSQMMSYWAAFARAGRPGKGVGGDLPEWKPWSPHPDGEKLLILDTDAGGGIRMSNEAVTTQSVFDAIDADARLKNDEDRCRIYRAVDDRFDEISVEDYADRGC